MTAKDAAASARATVTMICLAVILAIFLVWGWSTVTNPFPASEEGGITGPECTDISVAKGERVTPDMVTVSVLNASGQDGFAGQTMRDLLTFGFGQGDVRDAPEGAKVPRVQIWASDPRNPAVQLVARYVQDDDGKPAKIVKVDEPEIGVNIVLGKKFKSVVKGPQMVRAKADATFCSPPS